MGKAHRKFNRPRTQRVVLQDEIMKPIVHYRYCTPHSAHTHCIYMFCTALTINSNYFPTLYSLVGLSIGSKLCYL